MTELNWAGNHRYRAGRLEHPSTLDELREVVTGADRVRVLGSRHSFNAIADADAGGTMVSLARLTPRIRIDADAREVAVSGGLRYGDVAIALAAEGWALANLASLPHISVAGAIATGTHGSGDGNSNLAGSVTGLSILRADGEVVSLRRGDADFAGAVVSLGALGVVLEVTLAIEPMFEVAQTVLLDAPWRRVLADFDAVTGAAYSVSLFTNWCGDAVQQVWLKERADAGQAPAATGDVPRGAAAASALLGARPAAEPVHMLPGMPAANCTQQGGVPGPWHERLPHFRLEFTPSNGAEIQSEYLMDRRHAPEAIEAMRAIGERIAPVLQVTEIRTMAADELWLSEAYGRDTVAFHFTWVRDQDAVEAALVEVERALAPFDARPHWGKVFVDREPLAASRYPRMRDFRGLAQRYDPRGVFRNAFLAEHVLGG